MRLGCQIIDLIRLHFLDNPDQTAGVSHVTVMQGKLAVIDMGILIQMVDAVCVEKRGAAFDAMDLIAFFQ